MTDHALYTRGSIAGTMLRNMLTMVAGTLAMSGYNLIDAYFIGKLPGTEPLAAIGFTFPIILLFTFLLRGVIVGMTTVAAHAIGAKNNARAKKLVAWGLVLTVLCAAIFGGLGCVTIKPLFASLGAGGDTLAMVADYMLPWYLGCVTIALAMAGNDLLLTIGKPKIASLAMLGGMTLNAILDPLFIFGWGIFPEWGIMGAAVATVIAQFIAMLAVLYLLWHQQILEFAMLPWRRIKLLWIVILRLGVPAMFGMLLIPIASTVFTRLTADFGDTAIAATTAAIRLEQAAFILPMAFGMTMLPVIGQNFGARLYSRVRQCRQFAMRAALIFLMLMATLFTVFADDLAGIFTTHAEVKRITALYLIIVSWGFAFVEIHRYAAFVYVGCGLPKFSLMLNALRILVLLIPLSLLAWHWHWLEGLFWARIAADVISGSCGWSLTSLMTHALPADGEPIATIRHTRQITIV